MKKLLIALLAAGLFQGFSASAQDWGRHDRGREGRDQGGPAMDRGGDNGGQRFGKDGGDNQSNDKGEVKNPREKDRGGKSARENRVQERKPAEPRGKNLRPENAKNDRSARPDEFWNRNRVNENRGDQVRDKAGDRRNFNSRNRSAERVAPPRERIPQKLRKIGVRSLPPAFSNRNAILRTDRAHSMVAVPRLGPGGKAFRASIVPARSMSSLTVRNHMAVVSNRAFVTAQVSLYNRRETSVNRYYWHTYRGFQFCHYNDPWGYHWYGWYVGPRFFWSRWYGDRWWWYDPVGYRWCYWYDGNWWWPDPYRTNVVYVYNDGNYEPADYSQSQPAAERVFRSKDEAREIKLVGGDAFLYDTTDNPSFRPVFLASNVKDASFSYDSDGYLSRILVVLQDGSFKLFDGRGNPYQEGDDNGDDGYNPGDNGGPDGGANPPDSSGPSMP